MVGYWACLCALRKGDLPVRSWRRRHRLSRGRDCSEGYGSGVGRLVNLQGGKVFKYSVTARLWLVLMLLVIWSGVRVSWVGGLCRFAAWLNIVVFICRGGGGLFRMWWFG